jgi:hypothetical protein
MSAGDISQCNVAIPHEGEEQEFTQVQWLDRSKWDTELSPFVVSFKRPIYDELRHMIDRPIADFLATL